MAGVLFEVTIDTAALERNFADLKQKILPQASATAINKTLTHARTVGVRTVAEKSGLKQTRVKASFDVTRATAEKQIATLRATGHYTKLSYFPHRQLKKGVKAKAWGTWDTYRGTFIQIMRKGFKGSISSHEGIFKKVGGLHPRKRWRRKPPGGKRKGRPYPGKIKPGQSAMVREKSPIKELWGPGIPREFQRSIEAGMDRAMAETLQKNYLHELRWRMGLLSRK